MRYNDKYIAPLHDNEKIQYHVFENLVNIAK